MKISIIFASLVGPNDYEPAQPRGLSTDVYQRNIRLHPEWGTARWTELGIDLTSAGKAAKAFDLGETNTALWLETSRGITLRRYYEGIYTKNAD